MLVHDLLEQRLCIPSRLPKLSKSDHVRLLVLSLIPVQLAK